MDDKIITHPVSFDPDLIGKNFFCFSVLGEPFAKQRPRAARKGSFVTIYTPRETKEYEKKVEIAFNKIYRGEQLSGALTVKVDGIFTVSKSLSKVKQKKMLNNEIQHTKKPDCDNMAKICLDALNGIAYPDDSIIDKLFITKKYGSTPMVQIKIIQNNEVKEI